jgi:two-component system sensor histidine kinase KdpD
LSRRLRHRLRQHELVITPGAPDIEAYMDVLMTSQVVQNILDNACKYTAAGTKIEIGWITQEGNGLLCTIRDYGAGLPQEKLDRVFDKYARLHKKDSQVAGTGLGLAISKAIMEAQGGWISAANHPDGGAVFTLCLPQWRHDSLSSESVRDEITPTSYEHAHYSH